MVGLFSDYFDLLYRDIPASVFKWVLILFCLGAVVIIAFRLCRKDACSLAICSVGRDLSRLLLAEYIALLYCSTVIFRKASKLVSGYDFHPFWSYAAIREGKEQLLVENAMNVVVFVPVGLLLGLAFRSIRWWQVILIGGGISNSIEALQYFTCRGFSEVDDVMHNTLGCIAGFAVYKVGKRICNVRR